MTLGPSWIPSSVGGGRYRLDTLLGRGGMGAVYAATHVALGRRVAIKLMHPHIAGEERYMARFRREAEIVARLEHPHIVQVIDVGLGDGGPPFLVMEYLSGPSLAQVLKSEAPLAPARAVRIARQILSALEAAHAIGVVHRDLKPGNAMLVPGYDGREVAKVVDFGIAHLMESTAYTRLTATGQIVGTPTYMAPEQALGDPLSGRTDLYALGALLYAMLAGRPPYRGKDFLEALPKIVSGDRPPLADLCPSLGTLTDVVERAMALDPDARWRDAAAMDAALRRWDPEPATTRQSWTAPTQPGPAAAPSEPTAPSPPPAPTVRARPVHQADPTAPRSRRAWPIGVALVVLAAVTALGAVAVWTSTSRSSETAPDARNERAGDPPPVVPVSVVSATPKERSVPVAPPAPVETVADDDAGPAPEPARPASRRQTAPASRATATSQRDGGVAPGGPGGPTVRILRVAGEGYDEETVRRVILSRVDRFRACYRQIPPGDDVQPPWTIQADVAIVQSGAVPGCGKRGLPHSEALRQCLDDLLCARFPTGHEEPGFANIEVTIRIE